MEVAVAQFGTLSWHLPGGTVEKWSVSQYFNLGPPKYQAGALTTQ